ncbi:MAG: gliding motility lipoprotein GldJ [Flavobacteriaceae bacterium]|nr:gliding motility lipoprotein GldJ [Flavobacteriaceae bacterium]|tara:strand:+ start:7170 stop:8738 length:1569 start_codon:yes stop_codon:yes gene_type:complete
MRKINYIIFVFSLLTIIGCNRNSYKSGSNISQATGWKINSDGSNFNYNTKFKGQKNAPGMIFIKGGTFVKGNSKDNVLLDWNNSPTQQFVRSFYIEETEVTNIMYLEYVDWLKKMYAKDDELKNIYLTALPDTLVWRNPLGFNEDMVNNYLRHPAFQNHPVVGVSWHQANNFSKWRTNRVNERILIEEGYISDSVTKLNLSFNTKTYLLDPKSTYNGTISTFLDNSPENDDEKKFSSIEDGILLPEYRLPTETEWEYAALGLEELRSGNNYRGKKKFPWDGEYTRSENKRNVGDQLANFKLGKGDYGGIAGWSQTGSGITTSVRSYPPNSYGLYGMAGNVAEWVADVYRPIIDDEANDFNYFRGNIFNKPLINDEGKTTTVSRENFKDQYEILPNGRLLIKNIPGDLVQIPLDSLDLMRTNYTSSDNRNYRDGDLESSRNFGLVGEKSKMYNSPEDNQINSTSLISNESRVYKGGSWLDRSYYLDPAQRRFLPEYMTTNFIGFRCAMSYLGEDKSSPKRRRR